MSDARWQWDESTSRDGGGLRHRLHAKECAVDLFKRPPYCDRGNWIAYVLCPGYPVNPSPIDPADAFPRYYFDLQRAKAEIEALFDKRGYTPYEAPHEDQSTRGQS